MFAIVINGHVATVLGRYRDYKGVSLTTNAARTQKVVFQINDEDRMTFKSSGEGRGFGTIRLPEDWTRMKFTITAVNQDGEEYPHKLENRGDKIVGEQGDDEDYNDVVVELHK